ncbi:hypothetical protein NKG94_26150 [Micromonospora sp. M12]
MAAAAFIAAFAMRADSALTGGWEFVPRAAGSTASCGAFADGWAIAMPPPARLSARTANVTAATLRRKDVLMTGPLV